VSVIKSRFCLVVHSANLRGPSSQQQVAAPFGNGLLVIVTWSLAVPRGLDGLKPLTSGIPLTMTFPYNSEACWPVSSWF